MGFFSELKRLTRPYDSDMDGGSGLDGANNSIPSAANTGAYADPAVGASSETGGKLRNPFSKYASRNQYQAPAQNPQPSSSASNTYYYQQQQAPDPYYTNNYNNNYNYTAAQAQPQAQMKKQGRVVNMPGTTGPTKLVLKKPKTFEEASKIADDLKRNCPIVLNLEVTEEDTSRRLLDFLSGVAYAQGGQIQRIAARTYMIMPYNMNMTGENLDDSGV